MLREEDSKRMKIGEILSDIAHRPWDLPAGKWQYYQEWNNALFLHWQVSFDELRPLVPARLNIDRYEGNCYVSLVAFTMQKIRPRNLPAVAFISDFHEINVRTYIDNGGKKGVFFLNIEAEKQLSAVIAKKLSGLPYEKSVIRRTTNEYHAFNAPKNLRLDASFNVKSVLDNKTELDKWLTERYCLYLEDKQSVYRYDIHHREWEINDLDVENLTVDYRIGEIRLSADTLTRMHYSNGVQVVSWKKETVT